MIIQCVQITIHFDAPTLRLFFLRLKEHVTRSILCNRQHFAHLGTSPSSRLRRKVLSADIEESKAAHCHQRHFLSCPKDVDKLTVVIYILLLLTADWIASSRVPQNARVIHKGIFIPFICFSP